jgi:hypothetical protein
MDSSSETSSIHSHTHDIDHDSDLEAYYIERRNMVNFDDNMAYRINNTGRKNMGPINEALTDIGESVDAVGSGFKEPVLVIDTHGLADVETSRGVDGTVAIEWTPQNAGSSTAAAEKKAVKMPPTVDAPVPEQQSPEHQSSEKQSPEQQSPEHQSVEKQSPEQQSSEE